MQVTPRILVLVEGPSDVAAVEALARRLGRDLAAEGVEVAAIGGAGGIARALGARPPGTPVAGLVDAREAPLFRRALGVDDLAEAGFFVCDVDLEDELLRALGHDAVAAVIDAAGDRRAYESFVAQPAQRDRDHRSRLRRWFGTKSGRKERYARLLVDALDLDAVPPPLADLLAVTAR